MEDLKIYFHGRPQGQNIWGVGNGDNAGIYLSQCLNWSYGKGMSGCLVIDHWNGDTYYSYIHRTNVFEKEGRDNAYCAITLRLQRKECHNVSTLYELLESAYSQLANIAVKTVDNGTGKSETFLISTFSEIQESLSDISKKVILNINTLDKLKNSIYPLQGVANTSDQTIRYSFEEIDSPAFRKDSVQNRILISKDIKTKAVQLDTRLSELENDKIDLKKKLEEVNKRYVAAMGKVNEKEEELNKVREENTRLVNEEKQKVNINYNGKKLSNRRGKPVNHNEEGASPNFTAGFQKGFENGITNDSAYKHNGSSFIIPEVWYRRIVLASLFLLIACSIVILGKMSNQTNCNTNNNDTTKTSTNDSDTMDVTPTDVGKTYEIRIFPNPQGDVLTVDNEYTLTLSDDAKCQWYYKYAGKEKDFLTTNRITPKTPNSTITVIAEIDGEEVSTKDFKTGDKPKSEKTVDKKEVGGKGIAPTPQKDGGQKGKTEESLNPKKEAHGAENETTPSVNSSKK